MLILVTGGCGFLGSNLARRALARGDKVIVFDNLRRVGAGANLAWLSADSGVTFVHGDVSNSGEVTSVVADSRPDAIFHVAGQVAMTVSLQDPRRDFEINALGTLNVLEAVRRERPETPVLYASTNKVYGDLTQYCYRETDTRYECVDRPNGFDESTALDFHSPYGCSKGAADQYVLDYFRAFNLNTMVFRHSSIYGDRQFATYDQGWVGWFCRKALEAKIEPDSGPFTISGDGKQVRDVLHVSDAVDLYFAGLGKIYEARGAVFNVGGGARNSLSLLELFELLESETGSRLRYTSLPWRTGDQRVFVADISRAQALLEWRPEVNARDGIRRMLAWLREMTAPAIAHA